ncbi:hypothetical protein K469DRAFT_554719 [Zopfia rhizophila CBS 207.26]|uniref:Nephrocystin 3-like N-terminal domain-containing protein n=1 Tax=Zopfia rhizophila CBS 207.26 TaxID=1314779 RepID=A0A6A6EMT3_9PEZI|nr:hypothetical protein K469DRAFT_554719 [Zopfia rhizophila CBS 207.26]
MAQALPQLDNSEYAVGWIAALPHERAAAEAMLDKEHAPTQHKHTNDDNIYSLGSINGPNGEHNVVIASLPPGRYGTTPAATAAAQMLSSFPAVKFGLMVGIGGGIPSDDNDIRLGDVVVSKPEGSFGGVRQYDYGKATTHGFEERGALNSPPRVLLNAMGALESKHEKRGTAIPTLLEAMHKDYPLMAKPRNGLGYSYQGTNYDRLFQPDYEHASSKRDCNECDGTKEVDRQERSDQDPYIHYGTIASGNQVIKDARKRDLISKNSTAAAYAKELLQITDAADVKSTPEAREVMHELQEIKSIAKEIILDRKQQDMFKWLSPLNPSARHLECEKKRVKGTGTWMLEDPKFLDWFSKTAECQTLCSYGAAGAGKTIISSLVIDKLGEHMAQGSKIGLGYIYCDYRDQKEQTTENILGAVLKQLLGFLPEIPEAVLKLYGERVSQGKSLSLTDAVDLLGIACAQFSKVYVCLDALDELGNLRGLLKQLRNSHYSIQIFITGRQHVKSTVQEYLTEGQSISITAHENDIRRFVEHEIGGPNDIEPDAIDEKLRKDIVEKVVDSAKGVSV